MTVSEAKRPKALEDENSKLKKLLADPLAVICSDRFERAVPIVAGDLIFRVVR